MVGRGGEEQRGTAVTMIKATTHPSDVLLNWDMIRSSHGVSQNMLHRALGSPRTSNRSWNKSGASQKGKCGMMEAGSLCATPAGSVAVWRCWVVAFVSP